MVTFFIRNFRFSAVVNFPLKMPCTN